MKKLLTIAALCAALMFRPASVQAASENGSRSEWLPEFKAVYVAAAADVKFVRVAESEAPRIVCETGGEEDTKFRAAVDKHGVLNISERILRDSRSRTSVVVYYHSMESLEVSDADVSFDNVLEQKMLRLDISGGARLSAELKVTDLEVVVSGKNTRVKLTGSARYVEIDASSGRLDASELDAMSVEASASYSAGVAVKALERLKTSASASATISYRGEPAIFKNRTAVLGGTVKPVGEDD